MLKKKVVENQLTQTATASIIDLDSVDPWNIFIEDLACIGNICRYSGSLMRFYSVAEHSVIMARLLCGFPLEIQLKALLHDAHEVILGDIPHPVKWLLNRRSYNLIARLESTLQSAVFERFGLDADLPQEVQDADLYMVHIEYEQLHREALPGHEWESERVVRKNAKHFYDMFSGKGNPKILGWSPTNARDTWLEELDKLCYKMGGNVWNRYMDAWAPHWMLKRMPRRRLPGQTIEEWLITD